MDKKTKTLTPLQEAFLNELFDNPDHKGNPRKAMLAAGYSPNVKTHEVMNSLNNEIVERGKVYLAAHGPEAIHSMLGLMRDPNQMGAKNLFAAAKDIMDRAKLANREEDTGPKEQNFMFVLPAKIPTNIEDKED